MNNTIRLDNGRIVLSSEVNEICIKCTDWDPYYGCADGNAPDSTVRHQLDNEGKIPHCKDNCGKWLSGNCSLFEFP